MAIDKAETDPKTPTDTENENKPSRSDLDEEFEKVDAEKTEEKPEWQDLLGSGSILKKVVREGEPDTKPQRLQKCKVNYELTLDDGTLVERKEDFELQLGDCDVVQGLDVSIGLMNLNEKCLLKIEPRLGFGSAGLPPKIPPNSTVVYDIELVSVEPEDDPETMSVLERKLQGNKKRERGNWWYGRGENTLAIQCYRRALDYLDEVEGGMGPFSEKTEEVTDSTLQDLLEDRISVCNNMAAAQIKLELYEAALNSLATVLRCQPNNVKALFRKAKVHKAKNDLSSALKCLKKADEVSPNNSDVQKEIAVISKLIQKQKVRERELAKRMFGGEQASGSKEKKAETNKKSLLVWSATLAASFAIGLAGIAAYRLKFA